MLPDLDHLTPISMVLSGTLDQVLTTGSQLEKTQETASGGLIQRIRYYCGDPVYARLVRIQIDVEGQGIPWMITPLQSVEDLQIYRKIPKGSRIIARLVRGEGTSPLAITQDLSSIPVRLEVLG